MKDRGSAFADARAASVEQADQAESAAQREESGARVQRQESCHHLYLRVASVHTHVYARFANTECHEPEISPETR